MSRTDVELPSHHLEEGGFRNPWALPRDRSFGAVLRWMWQRWRNGIPPDPLPGELPPGESRIAQPSPALDDTRITWIGHASALIQHGGLNVLTDPHWSRRAAPLQWIGPRRFVPPGIAFEDLPPIDAVLISHDHYDHLDDGTVRRLNRRFGDSITWFAPLGYESWLRSRGVHKIVELDWWEEADLITERGALRVRAFPAQHWTRRGPSPSERLWASWSIEDANESRIYFGGDSGYFAGFAEIGERAGPFDVCLLPIGAYEPRWFMAPDHMNPEEAVQVYEDLGEAGFFVGIHWGTFRLTDEDPLEPPRRTRQAWSAAGLPRDRLWIRGMVRRWSSGRA